MRYARDLVKHSLKMRSNSALAENVKDSLNATIISSIASKEVKADSSHKTFILIKKKPSIWCQLVTVKLIRVPRELGGRR